MSLFRQDPLTGQWVIMAAKRAGRPNEFRPGLVTPTDPADCPFCEGHESRTTPEILATGRPAAAAADSPGWRVRVFPNMYPALRPESKIPAAAATGDLFPARAGLGQHEVVAFTPDHTGSLATLSTAHLTEVLQVVRARVAYLSALPDVAHVLPFANHGPEAGATLFHPHLQILGAPFVPDLAARKHECLGRWFAERAECLVCAGLAAEMAAGVRMVAQNERWLCHTPWASRFPWEMRLTPRHHQRDITSADDDDLAALGSLLGASLQRLQTLHGDLSFNVVFHFGPGDGTDFHWHVDIMPRLTRLAGFEAGTGFAINSVLPEDAARQLRGEGD